MFILLQANQERAQSDLSFTRTYILSVYVFHPCKTTKEPEEKGEANSQSNKEKCRASLRIFSTNRLANAHQQHPLCNHAIRVVKMHYPQSRLASVKAETGPGREVVAQTLVVHDFEPAEKSQTWG
ncbi:predicted protein [Plenodomus lingam JN3]|uniref:Predicted protein n=1 Tax=Leptosphaeria maculans (strain JN3 / isolate v23.1.3 / race Av1-4-5-6-7-8) TaxID=985895 RepID=E4ZW48_LEPMJ|nr:predicted protein [Plenodomus lingam JN3]CBX95824.1 predicted protein [Plenodomus lingam JN3]